MKGKWTHDICEECWVRTRGGRIPAKIKREFRDGMMCCYCGKISWDGITIREDPEVVHA